MVIKCSTRKFITKMNDYVFYSGKNIPKELYDKAVKFDNKIFSSGDKSYCYDTFIPYETTYNLLLANLDTTIICYDTKNSEIVGLLMCINLNEEATMSYLKEQRLLKDFTKDDICDLKNETHTNLAVYSLGVNENLRGEKLITIDNTNMTINKALFAYLAYRIIFLMQNGVVYDKLISEGTSQSGIKLSAQLTHNNLYKKCSDNALLYANAFDISLFDFLPNYANILNAYNQKL